MINRLNGVHASDAAPDSSRTAKSVSAQNAPSSTRKTPSVGPEQVKVSNRAKLAQQLTSAARTSDGVSVDKVQALRKALATGQNRVPSSAIAKAVAEAASLLGK